MALQPVLVCKSHMFWTLQTTDLIMYCNPDHLGILTIGPNVVVIKSGFWHILKSTAISEGTHEFNLEIKSDLTSRLISKIQFLSILKSTLISRESWIIRDDNIHTFFMMSHSWVNIITLNDPLVTPSALLKGCWLFVWRFSYINVVSSCKEVVVCPSWFVLLSKLGFYRWEVIKNLTVDDVELSIWEDEEVTLNIPWGWRFPVNCKLNSFWHGLMLLWFTDVMNVTEEVTVHRLNVSTLLSSAFIRGDLNAATRGPFIWSLISGLIVVMDNN